MNRRTLIAAGSAALVPCAGLAQPAPSQIAASYAEWSNAWRRANARDIGEAECNRCTAIMGAIEARIEALPARDGRDLALKILALSNRWAFAISPDSCPILCREIDMLAAGVALMNRRAVLKGAVALTLPLPAAAIVAPPQLSDVGQIEYHARALRELIRARLPRDTTGMTIEIREPNPRLPLASAICAHHRREEWCDDPGSRDGGRVIVRNHGYWGVPFA